METRFVVRDDIGAILRALDGPDPSWWWGTAEAEWYALWRHRRPFGIVLESSGVIRGALIGALVSRPFYDLALSRDLPYLGDLFGEFASDDEMFAPDPDRDPRRFAKSNHAGLYLALVYCFAGPDDGLLEQSYFERTLLADAFLANYAGANLFGVFLEAMGSVAHEKVRRLGTRELNPYPAHVPGSPTENVPSIFGLERDEAATTPNHFLARILLQELPAAPIAPRLRRLLYHASHGRADAWIAREMGISPGSMKTYWDRIFESFEKSHPGMIYRHVAGRREAVLSHVRAYPAERWPI